MAIVDYKAYALSLGKEYFRTKQEDALIQWPDIIDSNSALSMDLVHISLPDWASGLGNGVLNQIIVPKCCCPPNSIDWRKIDWWRAIFLFATSQFEWMFEKERGAIHSYSYRLPSSLNPLYEKAWVNRIFLFLRRWTANEMNVSDEDLFSDKPKGKIHLTHDIDYIKKTIPLRIKQSIFVAINIIRFSLKLDFKRLNQQLLKLVKLFLKGDYWQFDTIEELEAQYNLSSQWNVYGGKERKKSLKEWLFDPGYSVFEKKLSKKLVQLNSSGHRIGLHQGFNSWLSAEKMVKEKSRVTKATGLMVSSCRQHWLRFSFKDTWYAQEQSGFSLDTTLGFNDRPGFRNSVALKMPAWIHQQERESSTLFILPLIIMDSQLRDYQQISSEKRKEIIDNLLEEVAFVGGEATVLWHPHVFHSDLNWGEDYHYLLKKITELNLR